MKSLKTLAMASVIGLSLGGAALPAAADDIVETAVAAGSFETLVAAVQAAGLVEVLQGEGPFTVFAPTDEAFAALPAGTLEELMLPENRYELADILKYHILPRALTSEDMIGSVQDYLTFEGSFLEVNYQPNAGLFVGNENALVTPDVAADNGVIHIIDAVLLP